MIPEFELIQKIKEWIPRKVQGDFPIGDDAAVLSVPKGQKLVYTVDTLVDGIDFLTQPAQRKQKGFLTAAQAGRKALAVNLSDMAAMGAQPYACVISLGLPKNWKENWLRDFYKGLVELAVKHRVLICGGDITASREFFVSIALTGFAKPSEIVPRFGAKAGDWIGVTGSLGGSILGKHADFKPRLDEARFLTQSFKPTSMIDISDGLIQDLGHLLKNSQKSACLEMIEIPISEAAVEVGKGDPMKSLEHACTDGEDFELLFTVSGKYKKKLTEAWRKKFPKVMLSWIGQILPGQGKIYWQCLGKNTPAPQFKQTGYQHFKS